MSGLSWMFVNTGVCLKTEACMAFSKHSLLPQRGNLKFIGFVSLLLKKSLDLRAWLLKKREIPDSCEEW